MRDLFKLHVSLDDSAFQRVFGTFEDRLNRHEQMILDLQRLLQDQPSREDLDNLKAELRLEFNEKLKALEQRLKDTFEGRTAQLERQIQAQLEGLAQLGEMEKRLRTIEDATMKTTKSVSDLHFQVQSVANGYGRINKRAIPLDENMEKPLNAVADLVTKNFESIFDALAKNQNDIAKLLKIAAEPKPEPKLEIDLSKLNPRPPFSASWEDPPIMPTVNKFETVNDAVAYIYEFLPVLQAHLLAIHGRVLDNVHDLSGVMDRDALEAFLEKLRRAILDMDDELSELRKGLGRGLTRAEVMAMINQALLGNETETAAGSVRCIACGKETRQVCGATMETDTVRRLGVPPIALALLSIVGGGHVQPMYSNQEQMQSAIQEAPHSVRPFRASCKVTKHQHQGQQPKTPRNTRGTD
jgi:hypothetical protein